MKLNVNDNWLVPFVCNYFNLVLSLAASTLIDFCFICSETHMNNFLLQSLNDSNDWNVSYLSLITASNLNLEISTQHI